MVVEHSNLGWAEKRPRIARTMRIKLARCHSSASLVDREHIRRGYCHQRGRFHFACIQSSPQFSERAREREGFHGHSFPSCRSSGFGTRLSAKLRFMDVRETVRDGFRARRVGKQSFQDKRVTKLELGHEGNGVSRIATFRNRGSERAETKTSLREGRS